MIPLITSSIKEQLTLPKCKIFALCFQISAELSTMRLILDNPEEEARPVCHLTGQYRVWTHMAEEALMHFKKVLEHRSFTGFISLKQTNNQ